MSDLFDDKDQIPGQGEEGKTESGTGFTAVPDSGDAENSSPEDGTRDTGAEAPGARSEETAETEDAAVVTPEEEKTGAEDPASKTPSDKEAGTEPASDTPSDKETETNPVRPAAETSAEEKPGPESLSETAGENGDRAAGGKDAGASREENPDEPENPPKQEEHDFDDEPKFDTQTGEPLSKPKSRVPGILMTFVVTAGVVCAIAAAFVNKNDWSRSPEEGRTEVETEAASGISAGRETEAEERHSEAASETEGQTENDVKAGSGSTVRPEEETEESGRSGSAGTQEETKTVGTEASSETETSSEKEKTDLRKDLSRQAVSLNTSLDVSAMASETLPSVVSVTSQSVQTVRSFFYGEQQIRTSNVGSGVVVDEDEDYYYIVTEAYLAAQTENLTVGFSAYEDGTGSLAESETDLSGEEAQTQQAVSSGESEEEDRMLQNGAKSQQDDALADAGLVGTDDATELAVLSVRKSDLPEEVRNSVKIAVLGDSDRLKIGERVVAIGDSLGYGQSVTQGIISALNRTMKSSYGTHAYIQTDASINYGNYGGALLDLNGHVIGINAGKVSGQSAEGMGYALPVNDAKAGIEKILDGKGSGLSEEVETEDAGRQETGSADEEAESEQQAVFSAPSEDAQSAEETEDGKADAPSSPESGNRKNGILGVRVADLSKENQIVYRVPAGVYVVSVDEGSGAAAAGIQADDVITAVRDTAVSSVKDLQEALDGTQPGDKVRVEYIRPDKDGRYTDSKAAAVTLQ